MNVTQTCIVTKPSPHQDTFIVPNLPCSWEQSQHLSPPTVPLSICLSVPPFSASSVSCPGYGEVRIRMGFLAQYLRAAFYQVFHFVWECTLLGRHCSMIFITSWCSAQGLVNISVTKASITPVILITPSLKERNSLIFCCCDQT